MISRAPFGQNGNRLVALFNWVTQVGFEIEGIYFVVATVILLFSLHGTNLDGPAKIVVIIVAALLQMIMPLLGHATITKVLRYLGYVFIVFFAVLAGFTFNRLHLSTFHAKPVSLRGVDDRAGAAHLPRRPGLDRERQRLLALPAARHPAVADLLGRDPGRRDPVDHPGDPGRARLHDHHQAVGIAQIGVPRVVPGWFVTPFLIFAVFQLLAINTIDMYSSGVTLQALGLPVRRWGAVIIDTVVCAVVTGIILFQGNFYTDFAGFLLYIVVWLAPWFGILITDYAAARPASTTRCRCGPPATGCTGATAASTGRPSSPRWSAWSPR